MLEEHAASDRVNSLLVHLLEVLDVRADGDLVSWLNKANERQNAEVAHLLDRFGDFAVSARGKT